MNRTRLMYSMLALIVIIVSFVLGRSPSYDDQINKAAQLIQAKEWAQARQEIDSLEFLKDGAGRGQFKAINAAVNHIKDDLASALYHAFEQDVAQAKLDEAKKSIDDLEAVKLAGYRSLAVEKVRQEVQAKLKASLESLCGKSFAEASALAQMMKQLDLDPGIDLEQKRQEARDKGMAEITAAAKQGPDVAIPVITRYSTLLDGDDSFMMFVEKVVSDLFREDYAKVADSLRHGHINAAIDELKELNKQHPKLIFFQQKADHLQKAQVEGLQKVDGLVKAGRLNKALAFLEGSDSIDREVKQARAAEINALIAHPEKLIPWIDTAKGNCSAYARAPNEIKKSAIANDNTAFLKTVSVSNATGVLKDISTSDGGDKLWVRIKAGSITFTNASIIKGSKVYRQVTEMREGQCVIFSASQVSVDSVFEVGRVCTDYFDAVFSDVRNCD